MLTRSWIVAVDPPGWTDDPVRAAHLISCLRDREANSMHRHLIKHLAANLLLAFFLTLPLVSSLPLSFDFQFHSDFLICTLSPFHCSSNCSFTPSFALPYSGTKTPPTPGHSFPTRSDPPARDSKTLPFSRPSYRRPVPDPDYAFRPTGWRIPLLSTSLLYRPIPLLLVRR